MESRHDVAAAYFGSDIRPNLTIIANGISEDFNIEHLYHPDIDLLQSIGLESCEVIGMPNCAHIVSIGHTCSYS